MQILINYLVKVNQLHVNGLLQQELQPVLLLFIHVTQLQRELQNVWLFPISMHLYIQFASHQEANVSLEIQVLWLKIIVTKWVNIPIVGMLTLRNVLHVEEDKLLLMKQKIKPILQIHNRQIQQPTVQFIRC